MKSPDAKVIVAHVTIGDEVMIVKAGEINVAIDALAETRRPGASFQADIRIGSMTEAEFAALPEYQ
ncbi:hypothetical protein [Burkholderia vietnamiensis]|uniref:hypothetical protein n=1 Tax=Burkholderia vietnamiensis TaxID=60552 RepID=UPI001592FD6F|nr:hypothetical protein [Burkholderia vietnamiensis]MCA8270716.1 hypothetical protein [Burkholderia vietnamiensis]